MSVEATKAVLQAAHAGTAKLLHAQQKLLPNQTADEHSTATLHGCDPAALAGITHTAQPLIAQLLQEQNAGLSPVQRLTALNEAKESTIVELTKLGIFRNMVRLPVHMLWTAYLYETQCGSSVLLVLSHLTWQRVHVSAAI